MPQQHQGGGGTSSGQQNNRPDPVNNAQYAMQFFLAHGLSRAGAAGIIGNLSAESGLNPASQQYGGGPGRGIAQWTVDQRWASLLNWAKDKNMNPMALDTQLFYVLHELQGYGQLGYYQNVGNASEASYHFLTQYERPKDPAATQALRAERAQAAMNHNWGQVGSANNYKSSGAQDVQSYGTGNGGGGGGIYGGGGLGSTSVGGVDPKLTAQANAYSNQQKQGQDTLDPQQLAASAGWDWAFLKTVPELWKKFQEAIAGNWSPDRFASAVKDTKWYQTHAASVRQYLLNQAVDPATWKNDRATMMAAVHDSASAMGAKLSHDELINIAENAMMFGFSATDPRMQNLLAQHIEENRRGQFLGAAGATQDQVNQYAQAMGVKVSDGWTERAVRNIADGNWTQQEATNHIRSIAASAFPSYADQILSGNQTMADIASPYTNSMASLLELNPGQVNLFDPLVRKALAGNPDPKTGKPTSQGLWEFENSVRSDPRWLKTKNADDSLQSAASHVLHDFGFNG